MTNGCVSVAAAPWPDVTQSLCHSLKWEKTIGLHMNLESAPLYMQQEAQQRKHAAFRLVLELGGGAYPWRGRAVASLVLSGVSNSGGGVEA